jgi:hypothetical protein
MASSEAVTLARPGNPDIALDTKWGNTPQGWPMEAVRCGSIDALVAYVCFYAARRSHPELVPTGARVPIDPDFVDAFWRTAQAFTSPAEVAKIMLAMLAAADATPRHSMGIQVCEGLLAAFGPAAMPSAAPAASSATPAAAASASDSVPFGYLLHMPSAHQAQLLAGAKQVIVHVLRRGACCDAEADCIRRLQAAVSEAEPLVDACAASGHLGAAAGSLALNFRIWERLQARGSDASPERSIFMAAASPTYSASSSSSSESCINAAATVVGCWSVPIPLLAEHWALQDQALFAAIPVSEFLTCGWDKSRFEHSADGIRALIDKFNAAALWTSAQVIALPDVQQRAAMLVKLIQLASALYLLHDYSGLSSIIMGLRRDSIQRLQQTWRTVPQQAVRRLQDLIAIIEDKEQYKRYKETLKGAASSGYAVVPHLGAHTAEWTAAEMNMPETTEAFRGGPQLPSFKRYRTLWSMASPIVALQLRDYLECGMIAKRPSMAVAEALSTSMRACYFTREEDREKAVEKLAQQSIVIEPEQPKPVQVRQPPPPAAAARGGNNRQQQQAEDEDEWD